MRQRLTTSALAAGALALSTAWATTDFSANAAPSGAHYANGYSEPTCSVSVNYNQGTLTISCTGTEIGGVGNLDATALLTISGSATVQCKNHGGQIVEVKTQNTTSDSSPNTTRNRNGTLYVFPYSGSLNFFASAQCPNGNWTKLLESVDSYSYTYTVTFDGYQYPVITVSGSGP